MNKEEILDFLIANNVHKYDLLNEIYSIRDKRYENVDYTICVNGYISVEVLNKNIELIKENDYLQSQLTQANNKIEKIKEYVNKDLSFVEDNSSHLHYRHLTEILSIIDGSDE